MNSWRWAPLRYLIRKAATSQGFLDPIEILGRLRGLAQPSEVGEPIELLRAGVVFHARGLINSKVIQHNLDWVWPYWAERQYDPRDRSFLPRAFSVTHVNLTHRNWTAVGYPDCDALPVVDPAGLLTPFLDGWSLDVWVLADDGRRLLPSRCSDVEQRYDLDGGAAVETRSVRDGLELSLRAEVRLEAARPVCRLHARASNSGAGGARLLLVLRPQNAEGVSFINQIALEDALWRVNGEAAVTLEPAPVTHHTATYQEGDVLFKLEGADPGAATVDCPVGLASAAAVYPFDDAMAVTATIPLAEADPARPLLPDAWAGERDRACRLECPDAHYRFLYDAAITSLVLHTPEEAYPGPYTYKRFWFRDATFIIHALLAVGLEARARRAIECFFDRQTPLGYFRSQEGEWDSNGEVLWLLDRYRRFQGGALPAHWREPVDRAARWISRKCLPESPLTPHAGLLPAGFSAEHLGPNDYYYWDDFWSIAGLRAAAEMLADDPDAARRAASAGDRLAAAVERSLASARERLGRPAMPAAPYRRLDAGAIGSVAAGYPLQLFAPSDERLLDCVAYLLERCFVDGAFFQDMIHSGQNAYLTLQVAQVFLRAGDPRYLELMDAVARLASPTGQWPEAIHPQTGGGCMGDGHHVWAAAEWVLMVRNCFLREEGDTLVIAGGIPERWLATGEPLAFGPAPTTFGTVTVRLSHEKGGRVRVCWEPRWHREPPVLRVALPGYRVCEPGEDGALLEPLT
ncbi:hypothetical protein [Pseudohaliea rubra]|uniref:Discoidin domain protein n=1 Tax=Pseudohaliea rubra DSM 19751 TaxID=1265313 RepID=A0A095VNQ5_9GAMM|nr:hypothetical protein [Pseudohaliea rubra]KGE02738.1 hypothetical protein HRUBRA_02716 [Pseudohaliea rubra DSM 19751]